MLYTFLRKILFQLDPEQAHALVLKSIKLLYTVGLLSFFFRTKSLPINCMGLIFPNPVGLSAGFDRNADYFTALSALGFGFIEIGTIIPGPQPGNPQPRIFRLEKDEAIINRMGFASLGLDYAVDKLERHPFHGILGINIGKRKDTPLAEAHLDYVIGFRSLAKFASYITINISSPNTAGLRDLLKLNYLNDLLLALKTEQAKYLQLEDKYVPIVIKISPDLTEQEIQQVAETLLQHDIDGVIASNTTLSRDGIQHNTLSQEQGGLSGRPLLPRNLQVIETLAKHLQGRIPIIASGGVVDEAAAKAVLAAGATLVQIYTGFIYQGPGLINRIVKIARSPGEATVKSGNKI